MRRTIVIACTVAVSFGALATGCIQSQEQDGAGSFNKLTYHNDALRSGWNDNESILTPASVGGDDFGLIWQSPELEGYGKFPARLFASPLFVENLTLDSGEYAGRKLDVAFVVTSTGVAYAINTLDTGDIAPGTVLWKSRITDKPCGGGELGNLSTPVIDLEQGRLYVTSCHDEKQWQVHALNIRSGREIDGWPVAVVASAVNKPGINGNGTALFPTTLHHQQRGALNLSPNKSRLYLSFGKDLQSGWLIGIDTVKGQVATAFSTTAVTEEMQGGMWASGGASVDPEGRVYIATGASYYMSVTRKAGIAGVFPESSHSWGQSILQLKDDPSNGFSLTGTYTPFNYCQVAASDIDLGSSGTVVIELGKGTSKTTHLLALGGAKQGNLYLLDRDKMPGSLTKRQPCSKVPDSDKSLLSPDPQPQFGKRGPLNLFGPYSDDIGMLNQAKSRSTLAHYRDAENLQYLFVSGSSKTGEDHSTPTPPGLVRVQLMTSPSKPAYPRLDKANMTETLVNPGSPVVSSSKGRNAIVWVMDPNVPRTVSIYGDDPPRPTLYAIDASTMKTLWKSGPTSLYTSGKYNEPTVVKGMVLVGTDRLQAFGIRHKPKPATRSEAGFKPLFDGRTLNGWTGDPRFWSVRDGAITGTIDGTLKRNTFLYGDRSMGNVEIRVQYRFPTPRGNSGLSFRNWLIDKKNHIVAGYQANITTTETQERYGMLYEENARGDLAYLGENVEIRADGKKIRRELMGAVNPHEALIKAARPYPEWNDYAVIAYGDRMINVLNGQVLSDVRDKDPRGKAQGIFALQLHGGFPMTVQFRNIRAKALDRLPSFVDEFYRAPTPVTLPPTLVRMQASTASTAKPRQNEAGRNIFEGRCAACHGVADSGAPPRGTLATFPKQRVIDALTKGAMRPMASGMSQKQVDDVADYLTATPP